MGIQVLDDAAQLDRDLVNHEHEIELAFDKICGNGFPQPLLLIGITFLTQ